MLAMNGKKSCYMSYADTMGLYRIKEIAPLIKLQKDA